MRKNVHFCDLQENESNTYISRLSHFETKIIILFYFQVLTMTILGKSHHERAHIIYHKL